MVFISKGVLAHYVSLTGFGRVGSGH